MAEPFKIALSRHANGLSKTVQDEFNKQMPPLKQLIQDTVAESAKTSFEKFTTNIPQLMQTATTEICFHLQPIPAAPLAAQPAPLPQNVPLPSPTLRTFTLAHQSETNMVERLKGLLVAETPNIANEVFKLISPGLLQNINDHHNDLLNEFLKLIRNMFPSGPLPGSASSSLSIPSAPSDQSENRTLAAEGESEEYERFLHVQSALPESIE